MLVHTKEESNTTAERRETRREYGEKTLALHQEIKRTVDKLLETSDVPCVIVSAIGKKVGKDPRTIKFHLKLLEAGGYGRLSENGKMFCAKSEDRKAT